jgi:amino-acid N-acetyltransferase
VTRLVQLAGRGDRTTPPALATATVAGAVNGAAKLAKSSAGTRRNGAGERREVSLRPATFGDVTAMTDLINGYATHGLMLPKTPTQIYRALREFVIAFDGDGRLLGCGALRIYDAGLAEICSLAVADAARGLGVGRKVVERLHAEAASFGLPRTFALTLEPGFFHKLGYVTVDRGVLPQKIEADCVGCPRRHACHEIAVVRNHAPSATEEMQ